MKLVYTDQALKDLDGIFVYQSLNWPNLRSGFERRLTLLEDHILAFPKAAPEIPERAGVRCVLLHLYPYRLYYRVEDSQIVILSIRHTAQRPFAEDL
jgi:hypothetical protein